jgi:hypothetical protein
VRLARRAVSDLQWWSLIPVRHCKAPIQLKAGTPELYVDASMKGWGEIMAVQEARGCFPPEVRTMMIAQPSLSAELRAVRYALLNFLAELRDRCVLPRVYSTDQARSPGPRARPGPAGLHLPHKQQHERLSGHYCFAPT